MQSQREIMADTENILDNLFFAPNAAYRELMDETVRPHFNEREDQIRVLLGMFAAKEYTRMAELADYREKYLESLLTPQAGEMTH